MPLVSQVYYSKYAPPDWIRQTKLHLSPYFPQVGDIVSVVEDGDEGRWRGERGREMKGEG
jgi:hypothetical protein